MLTPLPVFYEQLRVAETPAEYVFHRPRLYLETSVTSFLTARPSRDLNSLRLQKITERWWNSWRTQFDIYVSKLVLIESAKGDPEAAERRLEIIARFPILETTDRTAQLQQKFIEFSGLPKRAAADAEHLALASVHAMDFVISWNFAHVVNEHLTKELTKICRSEGYSYPIVCTPEQLMERYEHATTQ